MANFHLVVLQILEMHNVDATLDTTRANLEDYISNIKGSNSPRPMSLVTLPILTPFRQSKVTMCHKLHSWIANKGSKAPIYMQFTKTMNSQCTIHYFKHRDALNQNITDWQKSTNPASHVLGLSLRKWKLDMGKCQDLCIVYFLGKP